MGQLVSPNQAPEVFDSLRVLVAGGAVIACLVAMGVGAVWMRRKFDPRRAEKLQGGFTVERLEAMLRSGELSPEEFRFLRRRALGLDAAGGKLDNSSSSAPGGRDDEQDGAGGDDFCAGKDG